MAQGDASNRPIPFGPFVLERRIAVGGHAEVYLARPKSGTAPAAQLVIKRPLSSASEEFATLDREADLHRMVDHPNVVRVFGAGMVDDDPYLALEYIEGVDVYRLMRRTEVDARRLPPELAVYVARQVADALAAVHAAQDPTGKPLDIVHRDVTPSNIYLSVEGDVKLGDFGIARIVEEIGVPSTGGLKGKFGYFAPEQLEGDTFDHRADLFSLAVLLGELLIGERVFPGSGQLAVLLAIRSADIEPLRRAASKLPEGLFAVLEKALSKDPSQRFADAPAFAQALAPFQGEDPDDLKALLADWVAWARDASQLAHQLQGRIKDSFHRLRAVRSASSTDLAARQSEPPRSVPPEPELSGVPSTRLPESALPKPELPKPTAAPAEDTRLKVRREDGTVIEEVSFPSIIEMVATGELGPEDQVALVGVEFSAIREVDEIARHLMPSTNATTARQYEIGTPDYRAQLEDTSMLDVLARIRRGRETGVAFIARHGGSADRHKEIYFKAGRLLHVASSDRQELLGEYLVRRGAMTRDQLQQALGRLREHGGRLGDTLIAMGFVEAMDVFKAIRDQGRDRVAATFTWKSGQASYYRGSNPGRVEFPLDLDLTSPMMAGVIIMSGGDPRGRLPSGALIAPGPRLPETTDRAERGTAPASLQMVPNFAKEHLGIDAAIRRITTPRPAARKIGEKEAAAALLAARALEWVEF